VSCAINYNNVPWKFWTSLFSHYAMLFDHLGIGKKAWDGTY
jgi:hypothetical protein